MVRFAGYARKSEPKWPYFVMALAVILVVIVVLFVFSLVTQWLESEINKPVTTTVSTTTTSSSSTSTSSSSTTTTTLKKAKEKAKGAAQPAVVTEQGGLKVTQVEIKSGENNRLYCYTSFENADGPQAVRHVWITPGGSTAAEVELTARGGASTTWSYINTAGQSAGQWQVIVKTEDGKVLAKKAFSVN